MLQKFNLSNIKFTDILLIGLIGLFVYNSFFSKKEDTPQPITINIPETSGTSGTQIIEVPGKPIPVYINGNSQPPISVDSKYKELYDKAQSELEKQKLYYEAIKINEYKNKTLVDDSTVTIKGDFTTRGSLLDYKIDYKVKEKKFTYTPKVEYRNPRLSLEIQGGSFIPSIDTPQWSIPLQVGLENKNGIGVGYMYNITTKQHGVYLKKSFTIIK